LSRIVIQDIVMPIVEKIMRELRYFSFSHSHFSIQDERLMEFLEEEMRRHFGVIGANDCQHLREQLEEARKNDPDAFEFLIRILLDKYLRLAIRLRRVNVVV